MTDSQTLPQRIVSLLPSATEIVALLGLKDQLVGVSHECDFPEDVRALPSLTSSRLVDPGTSLGIHMDVNRLVSEVLSIYCVEPEGLERVNPSVVITQSLCEVCAVSIDDVRTAVARLAHQEDIKVVTISPTTLSDVLGDVRRVAEALGVPERGRIESDKLAQRVDSIARRSSTAQTRPRVVTIEWLEPIMLGGMWMPEMINFAGGEPIGVESGMHAPTVTHDELAAFDPEVVIIKPCGFSIERSLQEKDVIESIRATIGPKARLYLADGNSFFNRSGPRLVESLEILAACVHPDIFGDFAKKHRGEFFELCHETNP